jgi:hypothetical protein
MKTKSLILMSALIAMIWASGRESVKAGNPRAITADNTGTAAVHGKIKFEGKLPKPAPINMLQTPAAPSNTPVQLRARKS